MLAGVARLADLMKRPELQASCGKMLINGRHTKWQRRAPLDAALLQFVDLPPKPGKQMRSPGCMLHALPCSSWLLVLFLFCSQHTQSQSAAAWMPRVCG